jgi:hypothetical protein
VPRRDQRGRADEERDDCPDHHANEQSRATDFDRAMLRGSG